MQSQKPVRHELQHLFMFHLKGIKPTSGFAGEGAGGYKMTCIQTGLATPAAAKHFTNVFPSVNTTSVLLCPFLPRLSVLICPILCSPSIRSRYAEFQFNCQPSLQAASGCRRDSYAACLLAYTGIIGKRLHPSAGLSPTLWVGIISSGWETSPLTLAN